MRRRPTNRDPNKKLKSPPRRSPVRVAPVAVATVQAAVTPDPPSISEKIASIASVLEPKCAVALSPFRDRIIGARLQGMTYEELATLTLTLGGSEGAIPKQTIHRNLSKAIAASEIPLATELAEARDQSVANFDATRELQSQIIVQRERINVLTRREQELRATRDGYLDPRLSIEMTLLNDMIRTLRTIKPDADPLGRDDPKRVLRVSDASMEKLSELILSGVLDISPVEEAGDAPTFH